MEAFASPKGTVKVSGHQEKCWAAQNKMHIALPNHVIVIYTNIKAITGKVTGQGGLGGLEKGIGAS